MRKYRRYTQFVYASLVVFTIWLINPVMAGGGDPEKAKQAWPMIQSGALLVDVRSERSLHKDTWTARSILSGIKPTPWWQLLATTSNGRWFFIAEPATGLVNP